MAQTTSATMVVPDVWADMVQAEFLGRTVFGQLAATRSDLEGVPGETITFPKWNTLTDIAADASETVALVPEAMTTDDSMTATIKEIGKAVEITDKAILVSLGDPMAEARRQLGLLIARKVDTDLQAAANAGLAAPWIVGDGTAALSWDLMVDAISAFGDEWDPANAAGIVIHSHQRAQVLKDDNFISADKLGSQAVIPRGVIGQIGGVNVFVSDRITVTDNDPDPDSYGALLVKRNALGLLYKRRPIVETDRDILARSTVITTNAHYAVKRLDDRGIVRLVTN